jgi:hypothetical protein
MAVSGSGQRFDGGGGAYAVCCTTVRTVSWAGVVTSLGHQADQGGRRWPQLQRDCGGDDYAVCCSTTARARLGGGGTVRGRPGGWCGD